MAIGIAIYAYASVDTGVVASVCVCGGERGDRSRGILNKAEARTDHETQRPRNTDGGV